MTSPVNFRFFSFCVADKLPSDSSASCAFLRQPFAPAWSLGFWSVSSSSVNSASPSAGAGSGCSSPLPDLSSSSSLGFGSVSSSKSSSCAKLSSSCWSSPAWSRVRLPFPFDPAFPVCRGLTFLFFGSAFPSAGSAFPSVGSSCLTFLFLSGFGSSFCFFWGRSGVSATLRNVAARFCFASMAVLRTFRHVRNAIAICSSPRVRSTSSPRVLLLLV